MCLPVRQSLKEKAWNMILLEQEALYMDNLGVSDNILHKAELLSNS